MSVSRNKEQMGDQQNNNSKQFQKIQIPRIRGNLSSFNDVMNLKIMKIENDALNNLRNISEDKLDQYLTKIESIKYTEQTPLLANLTTTNTTTNNNNTNNSIITNNHYHQNFSEQSTTYQTYSPEKRKSSQIAGWDYDNSMIEEQSAEENETAPVDLFSPQKSSMSKQSQNGQDIFFSSSVPQTAAVTSSSSSQTQQKAKQISKKTSLIQLIPSELSDQLNQQHSYIDLAAASTSSPLICKQNEQGKPFKIRSPSPTFHTLCQDKSSSKERQSTTKIIKLRSPSFIIDQQQQSYYHSSQDKIPEEFKNNHNNGSINYLGYNASIIQNDQINQNGQIFQNGQINQNSQLHLNDQNGQEGRNGQSNQSNQNGYQNSQSLSANNTLYNKKILQNTKVLKQRQKALAQFQQQPNNLKPSQSSALYHIYNHQVHEKSSCSPLRGTISKSTHIVPSNPSSQPLSTLDNNKQEQENSFERLDFTAQQVPKFSYLNFTKGKRSSKSSFQTENSQLKTETDTATSPCPNDFLSQSSHDFQSAATKYVNYTQKLYKNIQSSIDHLQKQFENPIDRKHILDSFSNQPNNKSANVNKKQPNERNTVTNECKKLPYEGNKSTIEGNKSTNEVIKSANEVIKSTNESNRTTNESNRGLNEENKQVYEVIKQMNERNKQPNEGNRVINTQGIPQSNFIRQQQYTIINKSQFDGMIIPGQQISEQQIININASKNNDVIQKSNELPTYKNYQKLSIHKRQAKSVDRSSGQSHHISPHQGRLEQHYKTNTNNISSSANLSQQYSSQSANTLQQQSANAYQQQQQQLKNINQMQQKVICMSGSNSILTYCFQNKPLIRSSSHYQRKIEEATKSKNQSSAQLIKPQIKTSDLSATLQMQIQKTFLQNIHKSNQNTIVSQTGNNQQSNVNCPTTQITHLNTHNQISNSNLRFELKPSNSSLKFDPIFVKKV